ncbi:Cna B-type domain-containing protein, partial [Streptococcus ruminantium]
YANGKEIVYTVSEEKVDGYEMKVDGYNITNSYTPSTTSVKVNKVWKDKDNQDGLRPTSIIVNLLADG